MNTELARAVKLTKTFASRDKNQAGMSAPHVIPQDAHSAQVVAIDGYRLAIYDLPRGTCIDGYSNPQGYFPATYQSLVPMDSNLEWSITFHDDIRPMAKELLAAYRAAKHENPGTPGVVRIYTMSGPGVDAHVLSTVQVPNATPRTAINVKYLNDIARLSKGKPVTIRGSGTKDQFLVTFAAEPRLRLINMPMYVDWNP